MGMYDYLAGEQIKIFYSPIFNKGDSIMGENPSTWHSGGNLRSFSYEDDLPLNTLYYKYPKDFVVFDYRSPEYDLFIIKNGKLKELKNYKNIIKLDLGEATYDYYGTQININSVEDFEKIVNDFIKYEKERKNIELSYFPNGSINEITSNIERFDSLKDEYYNKLDKLKIDIMKKWISKDDYYLEKQFGEFLDCYITANSFKNGKVYEWSNPMQNFLDIKKAFKEFIISNSGIIEKYIKWLKVDDEDIKIIKEATNEILNQ